MVDLFMTDQIGANATSPRRARLATCRKKGTSTSQVNLIDFSLLHQLDYFFFMTARVSLRSAQSFIMSTVRTDCHHIRPRRFAPLDTARKSDAPRLKGIVFDVDGTLW